MKKLLQHPVLVLCIGIVLMVLIPSLWRGQHLVVKLLLVALRVWLGVYLIKMRRTWGEELRAGAQRLVARLGDKWIEYLDYSEATYQMVAICLGGLLILLGLVDFLS